MHEFKPLETINTYLLMRLLGHSMWAVTSTTFLYSKLIGALRREMRKDDKKKGILYRPMANGVCYKIACLAIDDFYKTIASSDRSFFDYYAADILGNIQDVFDGWDFSTGSSLLVRQKDIDHVVGWMDRFDQERSADGCTVLVMDEGLDILILLAKRSLKHRLYPSVRHGFASEIADRLIHDRVISAYIAEALLLLAPGKGGLHQRTRFVNRVGWPAFVKPLIYSRDRGKCAFCRTDIATELLAKANIDHIIPLARGGCNDVVNLQLCCEVCNKAKRTSIWDVTTSIPSYHHRRFKVIQQRRLHGMR